MLNAPRNILHQNPPLPVTTDMGSSDSFSSLRPPPRLPPRSSFRPPPAPPPRQQSSHLSTGAPPVGSSSTGDTASGSTSGFPPPQLATSSSSSSSSHHNRPLPSRPYPPSPHTIPIWDPETKSHIPAEATLDSRTASYANQGVPPVRLRAIVEAREANDRNERPGRLVGNAVNGVVREEVGGKEPFKPGRSSRGMESSAAGVISGEWWLDPMLPRLVSDVEEDLARGPIRWGSRMGSRKDKNKDGTRMNPAARFKAEKNNIDARLNIVVGQEPTLTASTTAMSSNLRGEQEQEHDQEPTEKSSNALIIAENKKGHIRIEIASLDPERGIDLRASSRNGNVFILLPGNFRGSVRCRTAASRPVILLPTFKAKSSVVTWSGGQFYATLGDFTPPTRPSGETFYRRTSDRLQSQSSRASSLLHPPSSSSSSGTHAPGLVPLSETLQEHHLSPATHLATSLPSSVDVSSVSGHVTIGIFDEEPKDLFEGMTLSSLLKGLSNVGGELKKIWKA